MSADRRPRLLQFFTALFLLWQKIFLFFFFFVVVDAVVVPLLHYSLCLIIKPPFYLTDSTKSSQIWKIQTKVSQENLIFCIDLLEFVCFFFLFLLECNFSLQTSNWSKGENHTGFAYFMTLNLNIYD